MQTKRKRVKKFPLNTLLWTRGTVLIMCLLFDTYIFFVFQGDRFPLIFLDQGFQGDHGKGVKSVYPWISVVLTILLVKIVPKMPFSLPLKGTECMIPGSSPYNGVKSKNKKST